MRLRSHELPTDKLNAPEKLVDVHPFVLGDNL